MVLNITISVDQWQTVGEINRLNFNDFLINIIGRILRSFDDCQTTRVILPNCTTKSQRFNIHKLSTAYFKSNSYDNHNGDRIMEIVISKEYIETLFVNYDFKSVVQATPQPSDRRVLFNNFLTFITENFEEEFEEYLNTI